MTEIRTIRTAAETALAEAFEVARAVLPGDPEVRAKAFDAVAEGLPHRRVEEWKYTDLRALMREAKPLAQVPSAQDAAALRASGLPLADVKALRLVVLNGTLVPELSDLDRLPAGVELVPFANALATSHPLLKRLGEAGAPGDNAAVALNTAFVSDGALVHVAEGVKLDVPLHVVFAQVGAGHAAYGRVLVVAEKGAALDLIESHAGEGAHQTNSYIEILAGDETDIRHTKLQAESLSTLHLATLAVTLGAKAKFESLAVARGSAVARQQVFLTFAGEDIEANLRGVSLVGGKRHLDTTLFVDHVRPGGISREQYKAALEGEGRSVFQGKIIVRREAQKTDGRMMTKALMLSDSAEADLKPELEIYADDVQCAHGATCAALDEEQVFYLMARGLPRSEAEAILVAAFVEDVFDTVENEPLRAALIDVAEEWLVARN
jgi:Fe-S cluster assembly protein SufD